MSKNYIIKSEEEKKAFTKRSYRFIGATIATVYGFYLVGMTASLIRKKLNPGVEELYISVSDNNNLDNDEKDLLEDIRPFLTDYEKYIDTKLACDRLEGVDIIYKESDESGPIVTKGNWSDKNNKIIYYSHDKDTADTKKEVLDHELIHLVSTHSEYFPKVLSEGITSTICNEYGFGNDSYTKYRLITYMLCEVVSSNTVIESYLKGDYSIIEKKLNEIDPNKELSSKLRENLSDFYEYDYMVSSYYGRDLDELEDCMYLSHVSMRDECIENIADILYGYYTKKTGNIDEKMDIYNTELRKDYSTKTEDYRNKTVKYLPTNNFKVTTSYFNKRNKEDIKLSLDEENKTLIKK